MQDLRTLDLQYLPGIGPARAKMLHDQLGLSNWHDLLYYLPYKHIDRTRLYAIRELRADMPFIQVKGWLLGFEKVGEGRKSRLVGHFTDGHDVMDLVWFNSVTYLTRTLKLRHPYIVFGRPSVFNGRITVTHPDLDDAASLALSKMGMQPYYTVTERMKKGGLTSRSMEHFTSTLFRQCTQLVPETLPDYLRGQLHLLPLDEALRAAHYPSSAQQLSAAMYRLKFDELFYVQLAILSLSHKREQQVGGHVFARVGPLFHAFYRQYLPFSLTQAQMRVIREMHADMQSGRQMNRLLQGDVGSGKTLVALLLALLAVDNGYQACLMAPTEILAEQHLQTFRQLLSDMPVQVELLTGIVKGKSRRRVLDDLQAGRVNVLVGTHAIIEDQVKFARLGLVIIDEQHRFGVAQRAVMWGKNVQPPHVLVMTATPIPRTLAMTLYGDLDVSVIDELPPGRKPVETQHVYENRMEDLYVRIRTQIEAGRQVYFVYPLIKESEKMDLQNVEEGYARLQKVFPMFRVSMVHGKMKPAEKEEEMRRFVAGETQILVATTVIEVGVNVPNASVMVIQNAERFGLSQLHQLRGRVGRGAEQSYCILVTNYQLGSTARRRMEIMTETNDGFEIAEEDLKLRGPGDLEGTKQSGVALDLKIANLARDGQIVQQARDVAAAVLRQDPSLSDPAHRPLLAHLQQLEQREVDWGAIS